MLNLNHHQWKLIFSAVRKQQINYIPDSKAYQEYNDILNEIFDLAYNEKYEEEQSEKEKARIYNLREQRYYDLRAQLDADYKNMTQNNEKLS